MAQFGRALALGKKFIMKDYTLIRGDLTEAKCIEDCIKRGYEVSLPFSGSSRYDVIADIDGKLIRIQCKASTFHEETGTLSINTTRSTTNTKGTKRHEYSEKEIDYFYTNYCQYGFLIPVNETSTGKILRFTPPPNNQIEAINVANDQLIDNVIDSIKNNKPIKKYIDSYIYSVDIVTGEKKEWRWKEITKKYNKRQISYIKQLLNHPEKTAYRKRWFSREFPSL